MSFYKINVDSSLYLYYIVAVFICEFSQGGMWNISQTILKNNLVGTYLYG